MLQNRTYGGVAPSDVWSGLAKVSSGVRTQLGMVVGFLVILALTVYRYPVEYDPSLTFPDSPEAVRLARCLYTTGEFANPFKSMNTGPSAHLAPMFPAYVALLLHTFGAGSEGVFALKVSSVLAAAVLLGLLPVVSRHLGLGLAPGLIATALWLIATPSLYPRWESVYCSLLILLVSVCIRRFGERPTWISGLGLGTGAGTLALLSPTALPVLIVWLSWLVYRRSQYVVIVAAIPLVMILPWIVRNYVVFREVIPIRDNLGLELAVSNNDCANYGFTKNFEAGCFQRYHPNVNHEEASRLKAIGEATYNRMKLEEAVKWIRMHPSRFFELTRQRAFAFWFPREEDSVQAELLKRGRRAERWLIFALTLISPLGIWVCIRRDRMTGWLLCSWLGLFPMLHYFVQYEDRYRLPVLWITYLLGALALHWLAVTAWRRLVALGA